MEKKMSQIVLKVVVGLGLWHSLVATAASPDPLEPPRPSTGDSSLDELRGGFLRPPDAAKPATFWWWFNNHVSKEGITRLPLPGNRSGYDNAGQLFVKNHGNLPLEQLDYRDTAVIAFPEAETEATRFSGDRLKLLAVKSNRHDAGSHVRAHEITRAVKPADNVMEIGVVNLWPNRLIGDGALPPEKRFTRTNIPLKKNARLLSSGLLGPVTILSTQP